MRAVIQRVKYAEVEAYGKTAGSIGSGVLVLLGINTGDDEAVFSKMTDKITNLRIFEDEKGKMNLSVSDIKGGILIVPNFTLYSDCRHGRRPDFVGGAPPEKAEKIFNDFIDYIGRRFPNVQTGIFRADMQIRLQNDGPVTIILDSELLMGGKKQ